MGFIRVGRGWFVVDVVEPLLYAGGHRCGLANRVELNRIEWNFF